MPTPGPLELVIILVIALLILGPGKLPDVGSALGKSIREFRKASSDLGDSVKVDTSPLPPTPQDAPPAPAPIATAATTEPSATPAAPATPSPAPRPSEPTTGTN
jgi:TatA/E family protein of Tat protein translocase